MSKAAKQATIILIVLIIVCLGYAFTVTLEKQKITESKIKVEQELKQSQDREAQSIREIKDRDGVIQKVKDDKARTERNLKNAEAQVEDLLEQADEMTAENEKIGRRMDIIKQERNTLLSKIDDMREEIEDLENQVAEARSARPKREKVVEIKKVIEPEPRAEFSRSSKSRSNISSRTDEKYWASVLKEKASLEVEIESLKDELSSNAVEVLELRQKNESLQVELDGLTHNKEAIEQDIKYKEDLINNLSLELARTKNDKKFVADRVGQLNSENKDLRQQVKHLVKAKSALEKSIVRISQDKSKIEKQLGETESIIQSKIDEIWEIKDSIDRSFKSSKTMTTSSEVELPPIIVSTQGVTTALLDTGASEPGFHGKVVSVNEGNNFVIVDVGEATGLQLGDTLNVYRDSKYIARLEVIQVRTDISAADIKDQWTKVKVGDSIR